jgi:hypothetical protein
MAAAGSLQAKLLQEEGNKQLPYEATLHPALGAVLGTTDPTEIMDETLALLQKLIQNKCINAGDGLCEEIVSIHTLRDFLAGYGLSCEIHAPPDKPKRPSLLATYGSGEGGPRVMLGPGHVDVVPANPEIWTQDPWAGKVVDGKVSQWLLLGGWPRGWDGVGRDRSRRIKPFHFTLSLTPRHHPPTDLRPRLGGHAVHRGSARSGVRAHRQGAGAAEWDAPFLRRQ